MKKAHFEVLQVGDEVVTVFRKGGDRYRGRVLYKTKDGARIRPRNPGAADYSVSKGCMQFPEEKRAEIDKRLEMEALRSRSLWESIARSFSMDQLDLLAQCHAAGMDVPRIIEVARKGRP